MLSNMEAVVWEEVEAAVMEVAVLEEAAVLEEVPEVVVEAKSPKSH